MTLSEARHLASDLITKHGLRAWSFQFDNAKTRVGICRFDEQVIGLSRHYVRANDVIEVQDTILHEIAHALAGPRAGHGPKWRRIARALGCSTARCSQAAIDVDPLYSLWCDVCDKRIRDYHRKPRRDYASGWYRHETCGGNAFSVRPYDSRSEAAGK